MRRPRHILPNLLPVSVGAAVVVTIAIVSTSEEVMHSMSVVEARHKPLRLRPMLRNSRPETSDDTLNL